MAIDGFDFTTIANSQVDPDSPVDTVLATGYRDNSEFLMRWLGRDFLAGAVANHDHDGVNSALVTGSVPANSVGQGELKTAQETLNIGVPTSTNTFATATFSAVGTHGFYPETGNTGTTNINCVGAGGSGGALATRAAVFTNGANGGTGTFRIRYVTASPPHLLGSIPWLDGLPWVYLLRDDAGNVERSWCAEDPPAYLRHVLGVCCPKTREAMKKDPLLHAKRPHPFVDDVPVIPPGYTIELLDLRYLSNKVVVNYATEELAAFRSAAASPIASGLPDVERQDYEKILIDLESKIQPVTMPSWRLELDRADREQRHLLDLVLSGDLSGVDQLTRSMSDDRSHPDHKFLPKMPGIFIPDGSTPPLIRVMTQP